MDLSLDIVHKQGTILVVHTSTWHLPKHHLSIQMLDRSLINIRKELGEK
jgi:hypothetical protein